MIHDLRATSWFRWLAIPWTGLLIVLPGLHLVGVIH